MMKPRFAVLKASGINRDETTKAALESAGAVADIVHVKQFVSGDAKLYFYQGLFIPGGFSYGDHIQSGVVLALELRKRFSYVLMEHAYTKKRLIIGICNGFQTLVQLGLLPFGEIVPRSHLQASLTNNASGRFESRWIRVKSRRSACPYIFGGEHMSFPVAHGEGRFIASEKTMKKIIDSNQIVWQYSDMDGRPTQHYPENPNGSRYAVAGICDPTGIIFGAMPHPEDYVIREHYPNWRRASKYYTPDGLQFFKHIVAYAKRS